MSDVEVVRFYTRARRIQQVIGATPTGGRIPGGPYPLTAAAGFAVVLLVGWQTMALWATDDLLINVLVLGTASIATLFALKKLPAGSKSPMVAATGLLQAMSLPAWGKLAGRPVKIAAARPPRLQRQSFVPEPADTGLQALGQVHREPVTDRPAPAASVAPAPVPPGSGVDVQSLMDAAAAKARQVSHA